MPFEVADRIADRIIEHKDYLTKKTVVSWHAGEPLSVGISKLGRYFDIFEKLHDHGIVFEHSVQTNAMLINQRFAEMFAKRKIKVGVSVDGSQEQHDYYRRTRGGKGTFEKVKSGIEILHRNAVSVSAIAVIHQKTFRDPDAFYDSMLDLGIPYVGLNVLEVEGASRTSYLTSDDPRAEFENFIEQVFKRSINDGSLAIRELVRVLKTIMFPKIKAKSAEAATGRIITINHEGDFSTFSPELIDHEVLDLGNHIIGNVDGSGFLTSLRRATTSTYATEIRRGVEKCSSDCEYFDYCGGGAPANKLLENGAFNSTETAFCRYTVKSIFDVALRMIAEDSSLLERAAQAQWWKLLYEEL
ncbi:Anaerobic sulfatase-maturating enzyme [Phaeobacter sp. CECT 5382]|nr:Anaerobic sulfatase-maturating enzyme [Phaeobacter sp. CECT 5382]